MATSLCKYQFHFQITCLIMKSAEVLKARDWRLRLSYRSAVWQAPGISAARLHVNAQCNRSVLNHFSDVIMGAVASKITGVSMVCSTVCSGADLRKHHSSAPQSFVTGIHRRPVNSPHKGPVMRKNFPFDDITIYKFSRALSWKTSLCLESNISRNLFFWAQFSISQHWLR